MPLLNPIEENRPASLRHDAQYDDVADGGQINIPPSRRGALWKVISTAIRCPTCQSTESKALTGKRSNAQGLTEHYRECCGCGLHFRLVLE